MTKREFIIKRTKIINNMIINGNITGVYNKTQCFKKLDKLFDKIMLEFIAHCNDLIDEKSRLQHKHDLMVISVERFIEKMGSKTSVKMYNEFIHLLKNEFNRKV